MTTSTSAPLVKDPREKWKDSGIANAKPTKSVANAVKSLIKENLDFIKYLKRRINLNKIAKF